MEYSKTEYQIQKDIHSTRFHPDKRKQIVSVAVLKELEQNVQQEVRNEGSLEETSENLHLREMNLKQEGAFLGHFEESHYRQSHETRE